MKRVIMSFFTICCLIVFNCFILVQASIQSDQIPQTSGLTERDFISTEIKQMGYDLANYSVSVSEINSEYSKPDHPGFIDEKYGVEIRIVKNAGDMCLESMTDEIRLLMRNMVKVNISKYIGREISTEEFELVLNFNWREDDKSILPDDLAQLDEWKYEECYPEIFEFLLPTPHVNENRISFLVAADGFKNQVTDIVFYRASFYDSDTEIYLFGSFEANVWELCPHSSREYPRYNINRDYVREISAEIDAFERHAMKLIELDMEDTGSADRKLCPYGLVVFTKEDIFTPSLASLGLVPYEPYCSIPDQASGGYFGETSELAQRTTLRARYIHQDQDYYERVTPTGITLIIRQYYIGSGSSLDYIDNKIHESDIYVEPYEYAGNKRSIINYEFNPDRKAISYRDQVMTAQGEVTRSTVRVRRYIAYKNDHYIYIDGAFSEDYGNADQMADALERHAKRLLDQTEAKGYVLRGKATNCHFVPLKQMEIRLEYDGKTMLTQTDKDGNYSFPIDALGKEAKLSLIARCSVDGNEIFSFLDTVDGPVLEMKFKFDINERIDLLFYPTWSYSHGKRVPGTTWLDENPRFLCSDGVIYSRMYMAYEYYADVLGVRPKPVKINTFIRDVRTSYFPSLNHILINTKETWRRALPGFIFTNLWFDYAEWHEYSHHVMNSIYETFPMEGVNHAGYINPSTTDSWAEGFAIFMPVVIADYHKLPSPKGFDPALGNLNANFLAWGHRGYHEPVAVAGILWDLYSGSDGDDNNKLTIEQIWAVLKNNHQDMYSVYQGFIGAHPDLKAHIDRIFINHGFFADTVEGNRKLDPHEPRNEDGFVDLAPEIQWEPGKTVGRATNYERPDRRYPPPLPDSFIKTDDEHPFYKVTYEFLDHPHLNHEMHVEMEDGKVYIASMPESYKINITVVGEGIKTFTGNPLNLTNESYWEMFYSQEDRGYLVEHTFDIESRDNWEDSVDPAILPVGKLKIDGKGIFFLSRPLIAVILISVLLVAVIGLLIAGKRRKKRAPVAQSYASDLPKQPDSYSSNIFCVYCGEKNASVSKYCKSCGNPIIR